MVAPIASGQRRPMNSDAAPITKAPSAGPPRKIRPYRLRTRPRILPSTAICSSVCVLTPALIAKLESSDWSMRKTAVEALAKIRVKEAVDPILKLFENEKGLMEEIAQKALVSITGQDFLYNRKNWRKWWNKEGKKAKNW